MIAKNVPDKNKIKKEIPAEPPSVYTKIGPIIADTPKDKKQIP